MAACEIRSNAHDKIERGEEGVGGGLRAGPPITKILSVNLPNSPLPNQ